MPETNKKTKAKYYLVEFWKYVGRERFKDNSHILGKIIGLDGDEIEVKAFGGNQGCNFRLVEFRYLRNQQVKI